VVRAIEPADGDECTRIVYEAFAGVHDQHRFPRRRDAALAGA